MLRMRGAGSVFMGKSTRNQRIERLWRDCYEQVLEFYYRLFHHFIQVIGLDIDDPIHIFALHYLFLPRLNQDLEAFRAGWNCHKLSTEHDRTPNQLLFFNRNASDAIVADLSQYTPNDLLLQNLNQPDSIVMDELFDENYVNVDGLPVYDINRPVTEPLHCPLTEEQFEYISYRFRSFTSSQDNIDEFVATLAQMIIEVESLVNSDA